MSSTTPTIFGIKALRTALFISVCWGQSDCKTALAGPLDESSELRVGVRSGGIEKRPVKNFFDAKEETTDDQKPHEKKGKNSKQNGLVAQATAHGQKGAQEEVTKTNQEFVKKEEGSFENSATSTKDGFSKAALSSTADSEDEDIRVKAIPEAPSSIVKLLDRQQHKDYSGAAIYADRFVKYMVNLMTAVREITHLIGEALVRQGQLDEEDWVGAEQLLDMQMAQVGKNDPAAFKLTHELALQRIKPDPTQRVDILVFCSLSNRYCREMAPDIERLWQVVKADPRLKMVMITLRPYPEAWVKSFRQYTGLTVPIRESAKAAKAFRIAFVPAMVIVSPGTKTSYIRTGQEDFVRMYEMVRTVQGLPKTLTPALEKLIHKPIGRIELFQVKTGQGESQQGAPLGRQTVQGNRVSLIQAANKNRSKMNYENPVEKF